MIIGGPGTGKSTLARTLGNRLGLQVTHIDRFDFATGWLEVDPSESDVQALHLRTSQDLQMFLEQLA